MTEAVFAIPGDKDQRTGGFIYEATVLRMLNEIGCTTAHLQLPGSFPNPTADDMERAVSALCAVPRSCPIILDGLVFGAIDPAGLARVQAPVIAMIHHPLGLETGLPPDRAGFLLRNETAALRHAAHVMVPSAETARVLSTRFDVRPDRITIAKPGFVRPTLQRCEISPQVILSVGLLTRRKGHDTLLHALSTIADLPWQAVIVGKEHNRHTARDLYRQSSALDLNARVTFAGELDAESLNRWFNSATVFALATRYEGYGMVLSEAMLFGLPIVSCDAGAVRETMGQAGLLVPPDDPEAFGAALRLLLNDPATRKRQSQLSLAEAGSLPEWHDTARIFAKLIRSLDAT